MKITVFTPTYNRAYIIENAYRSLLRQTVKDFEWIVVDDGSTDNTEQLFSKWVDNDNGFSLIYKKVPNGGKMRAVNHGLTLAHGELFLNLDSDDYLTDNAIETVLKWEGTIQDFKDRFAGVAGLRCHFDGSIIGTTFKGEYVDASVFERKKHGITGDRVEVFYTELFQRHPFPEFEGEKFINEGVNWMEICKDGDRVLRWFNEPIYLCEYREDGYSAKAFELSVRNPKGLLHNIHRTIELAHPKYIEKLRLLHIYYLVGEVNNYPKRKIKRDLKLKNYDFIMLFICHYLRITLKYLMKKN